MLYIGVDLGTSACKFLLVDETGKVCNQVSREYPLSMPHTGWSEQDPSSWWQACLDGIPAPLEVYATTLHYAPCHADPAKGFRVMVALPAGTNTDFRLPGAPNPLDRQLWARNKWLIAHPDSDEAAQGAVVGLTGENTDISGDL